MPDLLIYLGAAFLGGVILNAMPCVLPVLTQKVFAVIQHGADDPAANRRHGIAYTLGIMAAFAIFAVAVILIKASGELVGWGMQFQNPAFVAVLTALMVAMGLNGLGVFEITVSVSGVRQGEGLLASFGNGLLAAVMATPCSAPFLGTAAAFALSKETPAWMTMLMFLGIGFGLAFPFLLVSFVPALSRLLPKPGMWMETFKHLMGFTLLGAAVWLFGVLLAQVSVGAATGFMFLLLGLSVGCWGVGYFASPRELPGGDWVGLDYGLARRWGVRAGVVLGFALILGGMLPFEKRQRVVAGTATAETSVVKDGKINWAPFSSARVSKEGTRKRPVFMDYTADWCLNCKTNEKLVLETAEVRAALQETDILPMKADMTNEDDEMQAWLDKLGRSGIPAYVIYQPDGKFDLLPEVITKGLVIERLKKASERFPKSAYGTPN